MAHILLNTTVSDPVMSGGIEADHGERGRGDDETEKVGEFAVHGVGVMGEKAKRP
jgi:hypothetical protein